MKTYQDPLYGSLQEKTKGNITDMLQQFFNEIQESFNIELSAEQQENILSLFENNEVSSSDCIDECFGN